MLPTRFVTRRRVAARSSVMPLSWSFVCAIAPCRFACDALSCAMRCFWLAIFAWRARCWACASESSSAWTGPGATAGAANTPTRKGIANRAMRRRDRRSMRDRGKRWVVAWRVNEQASSSRASVSCQALRREATARNNHARRIWHRLRGHSRDDRFPASGQCTSVGNGVSRVAAARARRGRPLVERHRPLVERRAITRAVARHRMERLPFSSPVSGPGSGNLLVARSDQRMNRCNERPRRSAGDGRRAGGERG